MKDLIWLVAVGILLWMGVPWQVLVGAHLLLILALCAAAWPRSRSRQRSRQ